MRRLLLLLSLTRMASAELFPVIHFTFGDPGPNELIMDPNTDVPTVFQYRLTDGALKPGPTWYSEDDAERSRPAWFDDAQVLAKLPSGQARVNCHAYISQGTVPVKRTSSGGVQKVRLEPVPSQQLWNNNLLKTSTPGITVGSVSACCDPAQCPAVCLLGDRALQWNLEILAPQWGFDQSRVLLSSRATFGGSYETYGSKGDAGVWPVFRVPCDFCPIQSCNTTCVNGEFATDYAVYSAVRARFFPLWVTVWRDLRSLFGRTASSGTRSSAGPARRARGTPARSRACSIASGGNRAIFFSCLTPLDPTRPTPEKYPGISNTRVRIPGYFGWISGRVGRVKRES
jgi:hypothetical protein